MPLPMRLRARRYTQRELSARTGAGGIGVAWSFRELWSTDDAAAVASPRTCEPGPGTWTITGTDQSIASGLWVQPSNGAAQGALSDVTVARVDGTTLVFKRVNVSSNPSLLVWGWRSGATLGASTISGFYNHTSGLLANVFGTAVVAARPTTSTDYDYAVVLRATGSFILYKLSSVAAWTLLYVEDCLTTSTLRPMIYAQTAPATFGPVYAYQSSQIPILYRSASGVIGVVSSVVPDFVAKMRCTGTGTQSLIFRRQDADNYWFIERAATTFRLYEVVATVATQRASAAITAATGDRISVACEGSTIRLWHQVAAGGTVVTPTAYASASSFATSTGMAVLDEANYTELEVFNRTQYGVAA
jgi:hypothetical protein